MEPNLNLFNCFTEETTAGEIQAHLEATGQRIAQDGHGKLTLVARQASPAGYDNSYLENGRRRALAILGDRYLLHPSKRVERPAVAISARGGK